MWMSTPSGAFTMLPKCTGSVTKHNVDSLGLRAPSPTVGGDPSAVPEPYQWRTLRAKLGAGSSTVSVCAALQTGAGAEALYIDNVALRERGTAATCDALGEDVLGFTAASDTICNAGQTTFTTTLVTVNDAKPPSPLDYRVEVAIGIIALVVLSILIGVGLILYFRLRKVKSLRKYENMESGNDHKVAVIVSD